LDIASQKALPYILYYPLPATKHKRESVNHYSAMRFTSISIRLGSKKKRASVEDLQKDVDELVRTILPCCQHRPSVYNAVSKVMQALHADIRAQGEDPDAVDFQSPTGDIFEKFVWFLPPKSTTPNSLAEVLKDHMLLKQLWDIPKRRTVRLKLLAIRDSSQADLDVFHAIQQKKIAAYQKQLDQDRALLSFVLDNVQDRPHIYNHVILQMQSNNLQPKYQKEVNIYTKPRHRRFLPQHHRNSSSKAKPLRWKQEDPATAQNRWQDVERLDELMDAVPDTSLALSDMLYNLNETCRSEAKSLQRAQSGHLPERQSLQKKRPAAFSRRTVSCPVAGSSV
jgi:hypothetical protein